MTNKQMGGGANTYVRMQEMDPSPHRMNVRFNYTTFTLLGNKLISLYLALGRFFFVLQKVRVALYVINALE